MNFLLPILFVVIGLDAPAQDPYPEATRIFHCRFERSWDENYDAWPDRWTRRRGPGFPAYVKIQIVESSPAGPKLLRIDLDGGGAVAYSPAIKIGPFHGYFLEGRLKTEKLKHNLAFFSLTLLDAERHLLETHYSEKLGGSHDWKKISLGPVSPKSTDTRYAIIGLHLEPGQLSDITGAAMFEDISLSRMPRMSLQANSPHHVYTIDPCIANDRGPNERGQSPVPRRNPLDPRIECAKINKPNKVKINCQASGFAHKNPALTFRLEDVRGRTLARLDQPLTIDRVAINASASSDGPSSDGPSSDGPSSDGPSSDPDIWRGSADWEPPIPGPGFYRVLATMRGSDTSLCQRELTLAVIEPRATSPDGEFGWTLPNGDEPLAIGPLAQLIGQAGVSRVKYPLWYNDKQGDEDVRPLLVFGEFLAGRGIELVGLLNRPPLEVQEQLGDSRPLLAADIFSADPGVWYPSLESVMTRLATRVRCWQLGRDTDTSFVGYLHLDDKLTQVKSELDRIGQDVTLGIGWGWMNEIPRASGSEGPCRFLALSANPPLTHAELATYLATTGRPGLERWVALMALHRDQYSLEVRAADLVRRMMAAKIHGAEGIFFADPFDADRGLLNDDGTPGELLLPWRTAAQALGGAEYLGSIALPNGSRNHVFSRDGSAVMVVWNDKPGQEVLYLGDRVRQVDLWGRGRAPAVRGHRQVIEVGPLPSLVVGINEPIARWRMDFAFDRETIPSIFGEKHRNGFRLKNHFPAGAGGRATLVTPDDWIVDPRTVPFQLAGGESGQYNFEMLLPYSASSGRHKMRVDFEVNAEKDYRFSVYHRMDVGLGDVSVELITLLNDRGELEVQQRMVNQTDKPASFQCQLFAPNRRRLSSRIIELGRGFDLKTYRIPGGKELVGKTLWLRAEEINGPRILNYRFVAAQ